MTAEILTGPPSLSVAQTNEIAKKIVDPMYRKCAFVEYLRRKGRVVKNCTSEKFEWRVKMTTREPVPYNRNDIIATPQTNRWTKAELPYRAYVHGESIDEFTKKANRGSDKIFNIWEETLTALMEEMFDYLAKSSWLDGNATGNEDRIHGVESWMANTTAVNSKWAYGPNDTYAGLSTVLGNYGGTVSDFPISGYTEDAAFWSPLLADPTYAWSGSTHTWATHWRETLEACNSYFDNLRGQLPDTYLMPAAELLVVKTGLAGDESIQVTRGPESSLAAKLGYDHVYVDGVELVKDRYCPADTVYGFVWDKLQLRTMAGQLFEKKGDDNLTNLTEEIVFTFFGNLAIKSPAYSIKVYNFSG